MDADLVFTNQPIVIDNGSGILKAGFAGDQIPKVNFGNYIGRPKHLRVMAGGLESDIFMGSMADEYRGLLNIRYPMESGEVKDWNDMEKLWQYVYSKGQLNSNSEEHPVLLTEAPLNPRKNKEKIAEIFFESFNVPALYVSMQAVLSLYSTGRTTGVVLDSGDGVTHAVPIFEGFALPHSVIRNDIAGRQVTKYLKLLLRKESVNFNTSAEFEIVKNIKERVCYLSLNPIKEESGMGSSSSSSTAAAAAAAAAAVAGGSQQAEKIAFTLPDGNVIDIGSARYRAPELLFRPDLIGDESEGIHQVLTESIIKSDIDLRKTLYQNIVLSGGSTLFKGFGDRLLSELKKLAPRDIKIKINSPKERLYSTWIGGSILASLDTFKKMWITKREYESEGVKVLHRKTF